MERPAVLGASSEDNLHPKAIDSVKPLIAEFRKEDLSSHPKLQTELEKREKIPKKSLDNALFWLNSKRISCLMR